MPLQLLHLLFMHLQGVSAVTADMGSVHTATMHKGMIPTMNPWLNPTKAHRMCCVHVCAAGVPWRLAASPTWQAFKERPSALMSLACVCVLLYAPPTHELAPSELRCYHPV